MGAPRLKVAGRVVGRYALFDEIATGGMATVHLGKLLGPAGFAPIVAIKCMHRRLCQDPIFVKMFLDEARLAGRIRHPNVVPVLNVVLEEDELFLVMEYVHGVPLSQLQVAGRASPGIASAVVCGVLHGLHAAHEAKSEAGEPLGIVHRDVSPHNIMLGLDGVARLLDFGVAKARGRAQSTMDGRIKGKLGYMAPEQMRGGFVNRQADVFAAGVILWEMLTGERLFSGDDVGDIVGKVLFGEVPPPSHVAPELPAELDGVVSRALAAERSERFSTARELALALQRCVPPASPPEVGEWVEAHAEQTTRRRARLVAQIDQSAADSGDCGRNGEPLPVAHSMPPALEPVPEREIAGTTPGADDPHRAPSRRGGTRSTVRGGWLVLLSVASLTAAAGALLARRSEVEPSPAPGPSAEEPLATPIVEPSATVVASDAPSAPEATAPPAGAPAPSSAPRAPRPSRLDCTPPYTRDAAGRKIYKRQCL